jgi:signal peptidase I
MQGPFPRPAPPLGLRAKEGRSLAASLAAASLAVAAVALARRRLLVVGVRGASMEPTFSHGDRLLVIRSRPRRRGQVILMHKPLAALLEPEERDTGERALLVKRVAAYEGDPLPGGVEAAGGSVPQGHLVVLGDSVRSYDSRQWGPVPVGLVVGRVVHRLGRH